MSVSGFTNSPIDSEALPQVEHLPFAPLSPRHKNALYAERGLACAILFALGVGVALSVPLDRWVLVLCGSLWVVFAFALIGIVPSVFRHKGWLVRDHDISSRYGVFTRRLATVPFVRVQNVAVRQSFFDRIFEIATLDVFTAGSDLHISGLTPEDAERLRLLVLEKAGVDSEALAASRHDL